MDGKAVHRFRRSGKIRAVIAEPSGVSCVFGFAGREC